MSVMNRRNNRVVIRLIKARLRLIRLLRIRIRAFILGVRCDNKMIKIMCQSTALCLCNSNGKVVNFTMYL